MGQWNAITDTFLAAAVQPQRWIDALELLADATGSDHAQLIGIGPGYSLGFNWANGLTEAERQLADADGMVSPDTNFRVAAGFDAPVGQIIREDRYQAVTPLLRDDRYLDLCRDLDIPFGCQTNVRVDDRGLIGFALLRSHRTGPTTPEAIDIFARAVDSAAAATALQTSLEQEAHQLIAGSFEAMDIACFVLDQRMTVHAMTRPAEALLRDGVMRLEGGRVTLPVPADDRRLASASNAVAAQRTLLGNVIVRTGAGMMVLKLHRLPAREWNMGFAPFAILVVNRPGGGSAAADIAFLRDHHGLTTAEAEVALLLRAGHGRAAICAQRGITRETLRSHLRALFAKLGAHKETEALHLLHMMLP